MAGRRRERGSANDAPGRPKGPARSRKGEARVIPFPQGRRSRRSRVPEKQAARHGRLRLLVGTVAVVLACLSLGARAVQLSVAEDGRYQAIAAERRPQEAAEDPSSGRGSILSADGRRLATSLQAAKVVATPYQVEEPEKAAEALAGVLGSEAESVAQIEAKLTEKTGEGDRLSGYSVVAEGVEPKKAREVRDMRLPGVSLEPDTVRVYPDGELASQLIGHLGTDQAYGGVEARYDYALKSGEEVDLTLDTAVQQELEKALLGAAEKYEGKNSLGLVLRVEDGAVVALANSPGYDNNEDFAEAPEEVKRNRALTDPYEPGSTFKPFTMAAALEEKVITDKSTFIVPDSIPVADVVIRDSEPHETEALTPGQILEHSRNVGTIQVAQSLGGERLVEYIKSFGFGQETGVDLWGEDPGRVPPFEEWSGSSIGNIPIGQGLTVTPVQLASGFAILANGGLAVTPHVTQDNAPRGPGRRVISEETSDIVRGMLQGVVEEGSGHLARIPGYTVAGKTGTAQKVDPETGLYGDEYVTSFIGFAPAKDPEYLVMIVVDEPQKDLFGEVVAAPAFQDVMSFTLGYFNIPPDNESTKEDPEPPDPTPAPDARKEDRLKW